MQMIITFVKRRRKWLIFLALAVFMFGGALVLIEGDANSLFSYAVFR
jgi:hypothetical protein